MNSITKDQLVELYKTKKNKEICNLLGITNSTLISYLKKNNIPLKGRGNREEKSKIQIKN